MKITLPRRQMFDEINQIFIDEDEIEIDIEHSLFTISKWEEVYCKPFLKDKPQNEAEEDLLSYIPYMDLKGNIDDKVMERLKRDPESLNKIVEYMNAPHTATTFSKKQNSRPGKKEIYTAEVLYYYMIAMEIPFECEHWHLNKLMTLIHVCGIKNDPKKMSKKDTASHYAALNKARRGKI